MAEVKFTINGKEYRADNCDAGVSLNSYLRNHANLRGTKAMCHEGGCGACIVSVAAIHPVTKKPEVFTVNSCLVSILSCHGWAVTTIEGLGNRHTGYHPIQARLAGFNGTQCGYCSPGWVMSMHGLLERTKETGDGPTMAQVENSFAGNICRCTGYRPILDAFKSFAADAPPSLVADIEDMNKICAKTQLVCTKSCGDYSRKGMACSIGMERDVGDVTADTSQLVVVGDKETWYKVYGVSDIFDVFAKEGTESYMLVAGNTAKGIYRMKSTPKVMIDISSVAELRTHEKTADRLSLGGNMTLHEFMNVLQDISADPKYSYAAQMYNHMDLVAHVPVRNIGTIAGNLWIKHRHNEFQSDLFVLFEAIGASITIAETNNKKWEITFPEFLKLDMRGKLIYRINLPQLSPNQVFHSYKIMPRAQNSHAHINAAFLIEFNQNKTLIESAKIVYGGVNPNFIHAENTEKFLARKNIFSNETLQQALNVLQAEIVPNVCPPEPSPEFRRKLCVGLFYKCILQLSPPDKTKPQLKSGGVEVPRPVSSGKQDFDTNKKMWPVNQPIPKIDGVAQCSGEATFANDLPTIPGECYATFVLSTVHNGYIDKIDGTEILSENGVIALLTSRDIPGKNNYTGNLELMPGEEEILASDKVSFYGQPVAIIVATSEHLAKISAEKVRVTYKNCSTDAPVVTIRQALSSPKAEERILKHVTVEAKEKGDDVKKVIKGKLDIFGQYHYTMETQTCVCVPAEDGMDVYPSAQWMDIINAAIAQALAVPLNSINIKVRRVGGGYGSKISRSAHIATACAVAAKKLHRPIRFVMPMESNMAVIGKRFPLSSDYEVGVDDKGKIQYLKNIFYQDNGFSHNESVAMFTGQAFCSLYESSRWHVESNGILTDTASNTWCRAPATTEAVAMIENIFDHIAYEMGLDPISVRLVNMPQEGENPLPSMIEDIKQSSEYSERLARVRAFNAENKWLKRGISLIPLRYSVGHFGQYSSFVSIYKEDGTVAVSHAGIEMGQGMNSKVAQVCAYTLGIPLEHVSIKPSNNLIAANAFCTGGSFGSEVCSYATMRACQQLLERLEPIRKENEGASWREIVKKAAAANVDLTAHHMFSMKDEGVKPYIVWAASVIEVEVDVITGNHRVLRADILEDAGDSLSPLVDVGQVEGAYIMGLGYWTSEQLIYDPKTGELLTNRSWNYKPPGVKDIPIDFRVQFRRNATNPAGVLGSKATGEPPVDMAYGIVSAIRQAITAVKVDSGLPANKFYDIDLPCTPENIVRAASTNIEDFKLY